VNAVIPVEVKFNVTKLGSVDDDESDIEFKSRDISNSLVPNVKSEIDFPTLS
jgi:hypothetical protein